MNIHRMRKFLSGMGKPISVIQTLRLWKFSDFMSFMEKPTASKRQRRLAKEGK